MFVLVLFLVFTNGNIKDTYAETSNKISYKGYQMWEIIVKNKNVTEELLDRIFKEEDVWKQDNESIDLILNENETENFDKYLRTQNISYKVVFSDVQEKIDEEHSRENFDARRTGEITWSSYVKLRDVNAYMARVAAANPKFCTVSSIGKTFEKRNIMMLKLSNGKPRNQAILIDGTIYGKDWVAVSSVLYIIEKIAWNFTAQPDYIQKMDWFIIPVLNPDGYEYSMNIDRLWRKNRRMFSGHCHGVDINRNFEYQWGSNGCSEIICRINYCGPHVFSEAESIAFRDLVDKQRFTIHTTVRSYGNRILIPWVNDGKPTRDKSRQLHVATEMVKAMRAVGRLRYKAGNGKTFGVRYGPGLPIDWLYNSHDIVYTYQIEIRGPSFSLKAREILLAAKELYAGINRLVELFR